MSKVLLAKSKVRNSTLKGAIQEYKVFYMPREEGYNEKISLEIALKKEGDDRIKPHSLRFENREELEEFIERMCEAYGWLAYEEDKNINCNIIANYHAKIFANFIKSGMKARGENSKKTGSL